MTTPLKYSEIKDWDEKALKAKLQEMHQSLFENRMQKGTSGVQKPHVLKVLKKNIARLLTAQRSKGKGN